MAIKTQLMTITPKAAQDLLETRNGVNRPMRDSWVQALTAAMGRGEWKMTHQGIAITEKGRLFDGQHRLAAIVAHGKPMKMMVTTGLSDDVFDVIDIGARRTAGDLLSVMGITNGNKLAAGARLVMSYDEMPNTPWTGASYNSQYSPHRVVAWSAAHVDELHASLGIGQTLFRLPSLSNAVATAGVYIISRVQPDDEHVLQFVHGVATGELLRRGDARLAFRNMMIVPPRDRTPMERRYQLALMIKSWNGWALERDVRMLKWLAQEDMPKPEPWLEP